MFLKEIYFIYLKGAEIRALKERYRHSVHYSTPQMPAVTRAWLAQTGVRNIV